MPRNFQLVSVDGVAKPTQSRCQQQCLEKKQVLAVPISSAEFQCMVEIAAIPGSLNKMWKPFWTGLFIDSQNKLAGVVYGVNLTGIE